MAFGSLVVSIAADTSPLDRATRQAVERVKSLSANLQGVGQSLALSMSAPIAGLGGVALKAAGDIQSLKLGLEAVAGGASQAEVQFARLREVAKLPGLGLQEAVQGSINLQTLGFNAERSRNLLLQFGNALSTVGRGREDLQEVIRQLGQLGSRGQVTADNLKPIIERVPQVASIIREKFGAEALGNPAETFKRLGISSQQLIATLEAELGKLPRVTGGIKNDFENLSDSITIAMAAAGEALAPFAKAFLEEFAVPAIERVRQLSEDFKALPEPLQAVGVGLGGIAVAGPLVVTVLGSLVGNVAAITEALGKLGGAAGLATLALAAIPKVTIITIAVVGGLSLIDNAKEKWAGLRKEWENDEFLLRIRDRWGAMERSMRGLVAAATPTAQSAVDLAKSFGQTLEPLAKSARSMADMPPKAQKLGESLKMASISAAAHTVESRILGEELRLLEARHQEVIRAAAEFRLGLRKQGELFTELPPKIAETDQRLRDLGQSFSAVRDAMRSVDLNLKGALPPPGVSSEGMKRAEEVSREGQRRLEEDMKVGTRQAKLFERQVSLIANDMARNITDLIVKGGKLKDVMAGTFAELGKSLLRSALETQLKRIVGLVVDLGAQLPGVGKAIGAIFGVGGGAASAAGGIAGAAGSAAGGVAGAGGGIAGAAGGVAGAAGSGTAAIVGAAAGVASAISGIIGNFQMAGMNKTLDLIEREMRFAQIHLAHILEKVNLHLPMLNSVHDRLATVVTQGVGVYNAPSDAGLRIVGGAGGGAQYNFDFRGAQFGAGVTQASIEAAFTAAAARVKLAGA